jgi:hypothetical protein
MPAGKVAQCLPTEAHPCPYNKGTEAKKPMNHYLAAALLMVAAIGFPMLCAAMGMKVNTRNGGWWD